MAQQASLPVSSRSVTGKGAARSLRREGKVPGVIYGHGREAESVTVDTATLNKVLVGISAATAIVDVTVDGRAPVKALIREIQRDPVAGTVLHLDLQHISLTERITVEVPIVLLGTPYGVKEGGGILEHLLREVEVECLPTDIPSKLEVDVSALQIGDSLHVSDLKVENGEILTEATRAIAAVVPPTVLEEPKPAEEGAAAEPEVIGAKEKEEGEEEGGKEGKAPKEGGKKG